MHLSRQPISVSQFFTSKVNNHHLTLLSSSASLSILISFHSIQFLGSLRLYIAVTFICNIKNHDKTIIMTVI